jgi:hypothetical protein
MSSDKGKRINPRGSTMAGETKNYVEIDGVVRNDSVRKDSNDGTMVFDLFHEEWKEKRNLESGELEPRREYLIISVFVNTSLAGRSSSFIEGGNLLRIEGKLRYQKGFRIDAKTICLVEVSKKEKQAVRDYNA